MRVRKRVVLVLEYEQDDNGFPADPSRWTWEELLGETVLSVESEDVIIIPDLAIGDRVKLTGASWAEMQGEVVVIEEWSDPDGWIFTYDSQTFCIYTDGTEDYSVTKVEP